MIWISSKTRNDSKSLDELTERGFCTMFLICQVTYFKETNADPLIKRPIFLVINSQLFLYKLFKFIYIFTLFIHPSTLNITDKTLHILMMVQQNRNAIVSTDFVSLSLSLSLYIYIYIYIYIWLNIRDIFCLHIFLLIRKIHKPNYPLRPIISQIPTLIDKLTKTIKQFISPYLPSKYNIKSTHELIQVLHTIKANNGILASLDVKNLFTNVPVKETIDIIINKINNNHLSLLLKSTHINFGNYS